ncbi:ABC transporter permease [Peribacillus asahii]|uniref:ABC transporter permease n=1 Tax=Peribacillus asahii TaxID=228899 RepID=UPI002079458B|nr:ABC transporter permease [Peribacillus asahii]USK61027.1 ABC transporter permease [Peribacillus asahii]
MESNGIIDIQFWRLCAAYVFVVILLVIVKRRGISREREIIIATFRMTVQLFIAGYVLTYIFNDPHPVITITMLGAMSIFSIMNIFKQMKFPLKRQIKWCIACSMMTGLTLALKNLYEGMTSNHDKIEAMLMLGAAPKKAVKKYVDQAFDSAVLPTINNMLGMGIVFLPGMMTGQILAGISPTVAIEYQIAVILGGLGGVSLTVIIFILLSYKVFFTKNVQLDL